MSSETAEQADLGIAFTVKPPPHGGHSAVSVTARRVLASAALGLLLGGF